MLELVIKNSPKIIENQIIDIINGVAREHNIDAREIYAMLKFISVGEEKKSRLRVFTHYQGKRLNDFPLNQVAGGITSKIEGYVAGLYMRDAKVFGVDPAFVNYVFQLNQGNELFVSPNIAGKWQGWYKLKAVMEGNFSKEMNKETYLNND
jgi:hypothetical protein